MSNSADDDEEDPPFEDARDSNPNNRIPNAADPVAIARSKQLASFNDDVRADFWKKTLATEAGRMVIWEVLVGMGTFTTRFAATPAGFSCPESTWFNAGEQAAGFRLYQALQRAAYEEVFQMHLEQDPYFIPVKRKRRR